MERLTFDVSAIREDFPILKRRFGDEMGRPGRALAYLDNAATTLKPLSVVEALDHYYLRESANVHRGVVMPVIVADRIDH